MCCNFFKRARYYLHETEIYYLDIAHAESVFFFRKITKMASAAMVPLPKSPPLGSFYTITTHLARGHHYTLTPQHESETPTPTNIAVREFLYNLCTVRYVTSKLVADQSLTRGDNIEILPDHYTSQQRAPALSMVLPTIASVDRVRLTIS